MRGHVHIELTMRYEFSSLELELNTLTKSADTAVVMRAYGPLTRPPHTNSMPGKHRLISFTLVFSYGFPTATCALM